MTISPFITPRLGKGQIGERTNPSMYVFVSDDISTHERLKTEDVPLHARLHPGRVRGRLTTRSLDEPASSAFVCFFLLSADAPARGPSRVRAALSLDDGARARSGSPERHPSSSSGRVHPGAVGSDRIGSGRSGARRSVRVGSRRRGGDDDDDDVGERTNDLRVRRGAARGRSVAGSNVPVFQPSPTRGCSLVFAHHARVVSLGVSMSDDDDDG